jgi:hypothetical protein
MAALLPFRKTAEFLGKFLPLSSRATASTVRNPAVNVGRRLQRSAEILAAARANEPCKELVAGFNGGYVRNRDQRPVRNFEVVAGKALDHDGHATRFAFVRNGGSEAVSVVALAWRHSGVNEAASVTVLTDGDAGLRAIHQQVAPHADHISDWFHIAMRFKNLQQLVKGISTVVDDGTRSYGLANRPREVAPLGWPRRARNRRFDTSWALGGGTVFRAYPLLEETHTHAVGE